MGSTASNTPNFPSNLNLEEWLKFSLGSENEVSRLLSLEEIKRTVLPPNFLPLIFEMAVKDPNLKCRDLATEVLSLERHRQEKILLSGDHQLTPQALKELLEDVPQPLFKALLNSMRTAPSEKLLDIWRAQILVETFPPLQEVGLTLFSKFGKKQDADFALPYLTSQHSVIVKAAIDLLIERNLDLFKIRIKPFLTSENLDVRLHAIRRLGSHEPREAVSHLEFFVSNSDPFLRQKALPVIILLPIEVTEKIYFRFIAREEVPLLLVIAGIGIVSNPQPDLPIKLFDIFLNSKGEKAYVLKLMVQTAVKTIQDAGILQESTEVYLSRVQEIMEKHREGLAIRFAVQELQKNDPEKRLAGIQMLRRFLHLPKVRKFLETHFANEPDIEIKALLMRLIGPPTADVTLERLQKEISSGNFVSLPEGLQQELLTTVSSKECFQIVKNNLYTLPFSKLKRGATSEIVQQIENFGDREDASFLIPLLESSDSLILSGVLRAIGKLDNKKILPRMERFLNHVDPRVKNSALELCLENDKKTVFSHLERLIRSENPWDRQTALSILSLMDFPSAEPLFSFLLENETDDSIRIQAGFILASNPSITGLALLFQITHSKDGNAIQNCRELWYSALESAEQILGIPRNTLEVKVIKEHEKQVLLRERPSLYFS